MEYCMQCGTKLTERFLKNEGMVPFCEQCNAYRFPVFSVAVSMEVLHPDKDKVLLIKQYGKDRYILVAGYINKGESAEHTVVREVREEIGLSVREVHFEKSEYFPPSNTLMLNFSCVDYCRWFSFEEAVGAIARDSLAERFLQNFLRRRGLCHD